MRHGGAGGAGGEEEVEDAGPGADDLRLPGPGLYTVHAATPSKILNQIGHFGYLRLLSR